jgi:integrase
LASDGWSPSSIHNALDPLRVIYRRARRRGEVAIDPLEDLDLEKPKGRRQRIAEVEEAAALLAALPEQDRALWGCAFYGGLRRGELRALRWSDIALRRRRIHVERSWDAIEGEQDDAKTDYSEREVPIIGGLLPLLRQHQMATGRRGHDLVFGRTATEAFEPSTIRRRAREACAKASLRARFRASTPR